MTRDEAFDLLRAVMARVGVDLDGMTLETDLRDDLGVDSIDLLDILFELGERCGTAITLEDLVERQEPTRVRTIVACLVNEPPARHDAAKVER
jgi:acyl carrier protein